MQHLLREAHESPDEAIRPICISSSDWKQYREQIGRYFPSLIIRDTILHQFAEVYAFRNPRAARDEVFAQNARHFAEEKIAEGAYNYMLYPWLNTAVTLLRQEEFIEVRTSRNRYKITGEEQSILSAKTIGIVGLSVGQSMAISLAMERVAGTLRIADFDTLELSNLNRLRAGVTQLGFAKSTITAREIAEIDPYLQVEIFADGVTLDNIDDFLSGLDLLIDECDGFSIKTALRFKAKALKLPVLMDTSDRGMIDVERFDKENQRPVFHGLVPEATLKQSDLSSQQILGMLFALVGGAEMSPELAVSFFELKNSINTWPQLASSVMMGAGIGAVAARQILLGRDVPSGRWFHDVEIEMKHPDKLRQPITQSPTPPKPEIRDIVENTIQKLGDRYFLTDVENNELILRWNPRIVIDSDFTRSVIFDLAVQLIENESGHSTLPVQSVKAIQFDGSEREVRLGVSGKDTLNNTAWDDAIAKRIEITSSQKEMLVMELANTHYSCILDNDQVTAKALAAAGVFPVPIAFLLQRADVLEQLRKLPDNNAIFMGILQHFTQCDYTVVALREEPTEKFSTMLAQQLCMNVSNCIFTGKALPNILARTFAENMESISFPLILLKTSTY